MLAGLKVAKTAPLTQIPAGAGAAELVVEGVEAVVPVVIAWDGEDVAAGWRHVAIGTRRRRG